MAHGNTKKILTGRKVYMTVSGVCYSTKQALEIYGEGLETALLAKAVLDEDGNVIGKWNNSCKIDYEKKMN
jgi:hypothetical protein